MENNYTVYQHVTPDGMYYFGQTNNIKHRWRNNGAGYKGTALQPYIEQYGWDNIQHIVLFENQTRENALWIEDFLIETAREDGVCINKNRSGFVSKDEDYQREYQQNYYEQNKDKKREYLREYYREYREQNKDNYREYQREYQQEYYEKNKDKLIQYSREYREQNKDKFRKYDREYYQKNRDKINEQSRQRYHENLSKSREKNRIKNQKYRQRKKEEKQFRELGYVPLF